RSRIKHPRVYRYTSHFRTYRKKQRRPKEAWTDTVEDWQLAEVSSHSSTGLRSAEAEALDHLPDSAVKDALSELREDYRMAVYFADRKSTRLNSSHVKISYA